MRILFLMLFLAGAKPAGAQGQRYQYMQPKMGSPFHLILYATDSSTATQKAAAAFALIDSLNNIFSDYDSSSELSKLSATAGRDSFVQVSSLLYDMIANCKSHYKESYGTFDITIGPLSKLWRQARRQGRFPAPAQIDSAKKATGMANIAIDTGAKSVKLLQPGMQLDLGGIGKGYIAQAVIDFLNNEGITQALADAGGDIVCSGAPPGKNGWSIAINVPGEKEQLLPQNILVSNCAVATSGDVYQFTEHEGKRYAHILNPATGYGVTFQRNVTVIAKDGATADWLATACSILPKRKAKSLIRKKGAALLVTQLKKENLKSYATQSFAQYWQKE